MDDKIAKEVSKHISNALKHWSNVTSQNQQMTYTEQDIVNAFVIFKNVACDYMKSHDLKGKIYEPEESCFTLFNAINQVYGIDMFDAIAKSNE